MFRAILGVLAFCLHLGGACANATVIKATFEGQTAGYLDQYGFFGPAGGIIPSGRASMTFIFDTALGGPDLDPLTGLKDARRGGTQSGLSNPLLSATFTAGGFSISQVTPNALVGLIDDPYFGKGFHISGHRSYVDPMLTNWTLFPQEIVANFWSDEISVPATLDTPFSVTNIGSLMGKPHSGSFADMLFARCSGTCLQIPLGLQIDSFRTEVVAAAVPLPASGLLLLASLGAAGFLRRKAGGPPRLK